jgi:hypothetical protein
MNDDLKASLKPFVWVEHPSSVMLDLFSRAEPD